MALPKGEEKHQLLAVLLFEEFNYSQPKIANFMGVSQSTISSWIKYGRVLIQNRRLENEVNKLRKEIMDLGYAPQKDLENNLIDIL